MIVYWLILVFHILIMPVVIFHALICKRDHRAALGWIGIIIIFPIAGSLLYFIFGINRLHSKALLFAGKHLPFMRAERTAMVAIGHTDPLAQAVPKPYLATVGGRATGARLYGGNKVELLLDGEGFYPRLLATIADAHHYICLSSYIFSSKKIGAEVVNGLRDAVARGVTVYVLVDGVGAWYTLPRVIRPLCKAGVQVARFLPPSFIPPSIGINLRNHRKIVVVDGRTGFFGGMNIDQRHMVQAKGNRNATSDVHFEVRGPVVAGLQLVFIDDWHFATRQTLHLQPQPAPEQPGDTICRVIDDGPDESLDFLAATLNGIFSAARSKITIVMPYFLPSREMTAALQSATLRGVRVRLILPEKSNLRMVDWATRNMLWELIIWHVEVYYQPAPFAHTKLILVDDHYVLGGSTNLDARSLRLNFELGVELFDSAFAAHVQKYIEAIVQRSRRLDLEELDNRPYWQRVRDAFFWLFSGYL